VPWSVLVLPCSVVAVAVLSCVNLMVLLCQDLASLASARLAQEPELLRSQFLRWKMV